MKGQVIYKIFLAGLICLSAIGCGDNGGMSGSEYQAVLSAPEQLKAVVETGVPGSAVNIITANKFLHLTWKKPDAIVASSSVIVEYKLSTESQFHVKSPISGALTNYDLDLGIVMNTSSYVVRIKYISGNKASDYSNEITSSVVVDYSQYNIPTITGVSITQGDLNVLNGWASTNYTQIQAIDCQSKPETSDTWTTYPRYGTSINPPIANVCSIQGDVGSGYRVYRIMVTYLDGMSLVSNVSSHLVTSLPAPTNFVAVDSGTVLTYNWDFSSAWDSINTGFRINYSVYNSSSTLLTAAVYSISNANQRSYVVNPCLGVVGAVTVRSQIAATGDGNNIYGVYTSTAVVSQCP